VNLESLMGGFLVKICCFIMLGGLAEPHLGFESIFRGLDRCNVRDRGSGSLFRFSNK
jgi:hypothetical protein